MNARDWLTLVGIIFAAAGTIYQALRAGRSADRAQQANAVTQQTQAALAAAGAENSGFTRAQEMVEAAAATQQKVFDSTVLRMEKQMADMQRQIDQQAEKIEAQSVEMREQHVEIQGLQRVRDRDRQEYTRYVQKLLALLEQHNIIYPTPPDFFTA